MPYANTDFGTKPSFELLILGYHRNIKAWKTMPQLQQEVYAKRDVVVDPQNYSLNQFKSRQWTDSKTFFAE